MDHVTSSVDVPATNGHPRAGTPPGILRDRTRQTWSGTANAGSTVDLWMWIVIAVVVVLVAVGAILWERQRQGRRLRRRFGPEYDREVARHDDRAAAHDELERRIAHREEYELRELDDAERDDYARRWLAVQRTFTAQPGRALQEADEVVTALFIDLGYPSERFDDRAADLSVEHADVTRDYREARAVVEDVRDGRAGTEEIRRAMLAYRTVLQRVAKLDVHDTAPEATTDPLAAPGLLPEEDRATLDARMQRVEAGFVDDATAAVEHADEVVGDLVTQLRAALDRRLAHHRERWEHNDEATTEQLRGVLRDYRHLFDALAATKDPEPTDRPDRRGRAEETSSS